MQQASKLSDDTVAPVTDAAPPTLATAATRQTSRDNAIQVARHLDVPRLQSTHSLEEPLPESPAPSFALGQSFAEAVGSRAPASTDAVERRIASSVATVAASVDTLRAQQDAKLDALASSVAALATSIEGLSARLPAPGDNPLRVKALGPR